MLKLATKFTPRQPAFETAHRAGFRCAEFWLDADVLARWQEVAPLALHYPFEYVLHFPNRLDLTPETLENAAALYGDLDCRCLVIHQPLFDRYHESLFRLAPALQPAVENHKLTPTDFNHWAERNPGLALDVEHLWKFTLRDAPLATLLAEVRGFLTRFAHKLRHVHMPGYLPGYPEHRPMYCARDMVFPVLSLLQEFRFEGLVVSEVNPAYQTSNELRMDVLLFDVWREQHDPLSSPPRGDEG